MVSIPLTGLAANDPVPGNYIEVNFAQGPASSGTTEYAILLMGNMLSTGSAQADGYVYGPDTTVPLTSVADAIALFGQGSELHRMYAKVLKVNTATSVYAIVVTESSGSKASRNITFATTSNANATLRVYVQNEFVDVSVVSGDTAATIATNAITAVNANGDWAVTASSGGSGILTITAKQKGLRGNFIRCSARFLSSCATTSDTTTQAALTGGTTADSNVAALATISGSRYYNIVSAAEDATQFGALITQIGTMAAPIVGLRQKGFAGSVDTLANATTLATGINAARAEVVWQQNSDWTPAELAANEAAVVALFEAPAVPRLNFSGFGNDANTQAFWQVKAPLTGTIPTRAQLKSALNNGLTPIGVGKSGSTYLVKRVTTRSLSGSVNDYRIRDAHKVTVCDRYADDLVTKQALQLSGKQIGDDPAPGQRVPGPTVVTPRVLKALVDQQTREYGNNDLLENVSTITANTIVVRESAPNTRLSARVPLDIIDILDQTATAVDQVG